MQTDGYDAQIQVTVEPSTEGGYLLHITGLGLWIPISDRKKIAPLSEWTFTKTGRNGIQFRIKCTEDLSSKSFTTLAEWLSTRQWEWVDG
jgi:hypothetical protein